jgi:hypothetical protein
MARVVYRLKAAFDSYSKVSKQVAAHHRHPRAVVLGRMLISRLLYDHGPNFFIFYDFETKGLRDWRDFLTKNEMLRMQASLNGKIGDEIATDKLLFMEKCISQGIPTPPVLGVIASGKRAPHGHALVLDNPGDLERLLLQYPEQRLIFKEDRGTYGTNLLSIWIHNGMLCDHTGNPLSAQAIWSHCQRSDYNYLIQEHLAVHPQLQCIMPGLALGTIRLITFRNGANEVKIVDALIKIPILGNISDNFHQGNSGNLLGSVDVSSGAIKQVWGVRGGVPVLVPRHPDTDVLLPNRIIPFWQDIVLTVRKSAVAFSELVTAGWDVALAAKGIFILEANSRYDIDGHQMVIMKGMRPQISESYKCAHRLMPKASGVSDRV